MIMIKFIKVPLKIVDGSLNLSPTKNVKEVCWGSILIDIFLQIIFKLSYCVKD